MSRHALDGRDSTIAITLGWDNADRTFFAEVRETLPDGDYMTIQIGEEPGEIASPEELAADLEPFADLDAATLLALAEDREFETRATHPVDPDQFVVPLDQPNVERKAPVAVPRSAIESAIHHENMEALKVEKPGAIEGLQAFWGSAVDKLGNAADKLRDLWGASKETAGDVGALGKDVGSHIGTEVGKAAWKELGQVGLGAQDAYNRIFNGGLDQNPRHTSPHTVKAETGIHGNTEPTSPAAPGEGGIHGLEADHSLDERLSVAEAYSHAKNAPGIRAEMDKSEGHHPYGFADAPDLVNRGSVYGASDVEPPMSPADKANLYGYEPEPAPEQAQAIEPQGPDR